VLAGPPAVGKTTTAQRLAASLPLAAVIDVDDIRHLVVSGHAAPWEGAAGRLQQRVGVENTCDLTRRFHRGGIDVVVADVLTPETMSIYRRLLPAAVIVGFRITPHEAWRRAALRPMHLTRAEFERLHRDEMTRTPQYDHTVDVDRLDIGAQVAAVRMIWAGRSRPDPVENPSAG
jgi:hypothetical protein